MSMRQVKTYSSLNSLLEVLYFDSCFDSYIKFGFNRQLHNILGKVYWNNYKLVVYIIVVYL
jgi:hypothetical protein